MYEIQEREETLFVSDIKEHLVNMNVASPRGFSKWQWRRIVKNYVPRKNRNDILLKAERYKKINVEEYQSEQFERKSYFFEMNLDSVRDRFRIANQMVETVRKNFSRKYRNKSLSCPS